MSAGERWGGWAGTTLSGASLALVALADLGGFRAALAAALVALVASGAAILWRPPLRWPGRPSAGPALLAGAILLVGAALIAPGSENVVGPRDPAVYVATGFGIARGGSTTLSDPTLALLAAQLPPAGVDAWLYKNVTNQARGRFPTQLFIRDLAQGTVEGGFLPVLPVWIALAAGIAGLEPALHVSGAFGVLALVFALLVSRAVTAESGPRLAPAWPLVGALLAVSFPQVWWAREPMAEAALGAFTWLVAWAGVHWQGGRGWRWALLAALGTAAALFTRADGILLAAALGVLVLLYRAPGRWVLLALLPPALAAAGVHYALVAPIYMGTTYGSFTFGRAIGGLVAVGVGAGAVFLAAAAARRWPQAVRWARRGATLVALGIGITAALSGLAPGVGRTATLGAPSPLTWLPGYVPWPALVLAALGLVVIGWSGAPRAVVPLLLIGGLPTLLYLPDPLVTGDHPWMVRRLVPAVIPFLSMLASIGALALWRWHRLDERQPVLGPLAAAMLVGLALALAVAQDRDLARPRHAAGAVAGLAELAAGLPPNAVVVFPAGTAGIHLGLPLDFEFGVAGFAIPEPTLTADVAATLTRLQATGRSIYWAQEGSPPSVVPPGTVMAPVRTVSVRYATADGGRVPPPLELRLVEHRVGLYRLEFPSDAAQ